MATIDAPAVDTAIDAHSDASIDIPWAVDQTSGKACPANSSQWASFIEKKQLGISLPGGIWSLQDAGGTLVDDVGTTGLVPSNTDSSTYRQDVVGWSRLSVAASGGQNTTFSNNVAADLPDVSTTSMTVLLYYATAKAPSLTRSVLFAGSGTAASAAEVGIDASSHFRFTVGATSAVGTVDHGTSVVPIILKLDHTHLQQRLTVDRELITFTYSALNSSRGLLLGAAHNQTPDGRWLYMVAWYGSAAELTDTQLDALQTALGW